MLEVNPKIGLNLFYNDSKSGEQAVDMKPDEVLEYLEELEKVSPQKDENQSYVESYLDYIIKN